MSFVLGARVLRIVADYLDGQPLDCIAERYGIASHTVGHMAQRIDRRCHAARATAIRVRRQREKEAAA